MNERFSLYKVNMKYIRNLANVDRRVMSISPQTGKDERIFIGIVTMVNNHQYCIPFTSVKDKFNNINENITLRKVKDKNGDVIAVLNLNNMIPIRAEYITIYDIKPNEKDSVEQIRRKKFCAKELAWCQKNQSEIERLAKELHRMYCEDEKFKKRKICLDFLKLEKECDKAKKINGNK